MAGTGHEQAGRIILHVVTSPDLETCGVTTASSNRSWIEAGFTCVTKSWIVIRTTASCLAALLLGEKLVTTGWPGSPVMIVKSSMK
jgi:hypothetical protein